MKKSSTNPNYYYFSPEMKLRVGVGTYWKINPCKGPVTQERSFHFKPSITFSPFQPLYFHFIIDPNFPLSRTTYLTTIQVVKYFKHGSFTYTLKKNFLNGHKILYKPVILMPLHGERRWDAFFDIDSGVLGVQKTFVDYRLNYFKNLNEKSSKNLNETVIIESIPINKEVSLTNNFMTFTILFILILRFFIMRFWNKKNRKDEIKKIDINEIREKLKKYKNNDDDNNNNKIKKL